MHDMATWLPLALPVPDIANGAQPASHWGCVGWRTFLSAVLHQPLPICLNCHMTQTFLLSLGWGIAPRHLPRFENGKHKQPIIEITDFELEDLKPLCK